MDDALSGRRVIIAEDEFLSRAMLEDMLGELTAQVVACVPSVEELSRAVDEHAPDIVTLDVVLRGKRAYDVGLALVERGIPFIFVTGHATLDDCPPGLQAVPRVEKPVRKEELAAALRQALAGRGTGR